MKNIVNTQGITPNILHFQGKSRERFAETLESYVTQPVVLPNNISIVTPCNENKYATAPLIRQLRTSDIPFINPSFFFDGAWNNAMKPDFLLEGLSAVTTEYVLCLDALDVVIAHTDDICERFTSYGREVLFCAGANRFPDVEIDTVENREALGGFCYLNAGACIGKTDQVRKFYHLCQKTRRSDDNFPFSEQYIVRKVFNVSQDWVAFDRQCLCFQTFCRVKMEDVDARTQRVVLPQKEVAV